jgi:hypothetical protein
MMILRSLSLYAKHVLLVCTVEVVVVVVSLGLPHARTRQFYVVHNYFSSNEIT